MIYKVTRPDGSTVFVHGVTTRLAAMQHAMEGDGYSAQAAKADEVLDLDPDQLIRVKKDGGED